MIRNLLFADWPKQYFLGCTSVSSIRGFNVVQPETRFHFQSANQIAKKVQISKFSFKISKFYKSFKKFQNLNNLKGHYLPNRKFLLPVKLSDMIDALIKRVSVTYKCYEMYAHRGKIVQLLVF
jgi:hypothetical protein